MSGIELLQTLDSTGYSIMKALVSILWQSSILLLSVGIISYFLRHRNPSVRFILWVSAILLIPLLPFITSGIAVIGMPQKEFAVIPEYTTPVDITFSQSKQREPPVPVYSQEEVFNNVAEEQPLHESQRQVIPEIDRGEDQAGSVSFGELVTSYPWSFVLLAYFAGLLVFMCWILIGRLRIREWIANGEAVIDESIIRVFLEAGARLGIKREFIVIESAHAPTPFTCRTIRPVIILPSGFAENLTEKELFSVALHELSHIKRNDVAVLSMLSFIKALFFFHPLVWMAIRQISYLAELSCDSLVLEHTKESVSYADMLTKIAENLPKRAITIELAAGFIFSKSLFAKRIHAILSMHRGKIRSLSRLTIAGITVGVVLSIVAALALPLSEKNTENYKKIPVAGRVLFEGKPVSNVKVYFLFLSSSNGMKASVEKTAKTRRDGSFRFNLEEFKLNSLSYYPKIAVYHERYAVGNCTNDESARR